ncbi:MAG: Xaa-Pro peptidase family protein [Candidatus Promineifilaceae bacterium]|nr:Xaa-Pro peptidase family protein [Candidatus Promineifilaceae bacterium]
MSESLYFPPEEFEQRLGRLQTAMAERALDGCLISGPENVFYLCGLSHQGFFAYHALIVTREGEMALIARAMERVTVEALVSSARFIGYADGDDPVRVTVEALRELELGTGRLGVEKGNLFLPPRITEGIAFCLPQIELVDVTGLVDGFRQAKSARELAYTRQAAAVTDAMMAAALETAGPGVNEREVAAAVHEAMILAGGTYPGFGPFVRSTPTLGQEHRTWQDRALQPGDALFVEVAGCVRRYHAPMGRLIYIGEAPPGTGEMEKVCLEAFACITNAIRPGALARDVYGAWQARVDAAGLAHYRRHHCGYLVGIGFPPSWVGGSTVVGLRHDSDLELREGMVFHLMSWLMGTGRNGDYFVSDAAVVTADGCTRLTTTPQHLHVVH